nr:CbtB domain-containing protein [Kibdelosporangium sp. MJ126-NF4]CEL16612.1 hypothetical protein [Kibdelosporangium sp. MJ126-NF4]CTQ89037.1 hypothetical protein [Kibdelosporangium sp. MJ126-NF4]
MTTEAISVPVPIRIPIRTILPWAVFFAIVALFLLYFVGSAQGAVIAGPDNLMHEFVHDGRHLLGFPCH